VTFTNAERSGRDDTRASWTASQAASRSTGSEYGPFRPNRSSGQASDAQILVTAIASRWVIRTSSTVCWPNRTDMNSTLSPLRVYTHSPP